MSRRFAHAVILGKFIPPHHGHDVVIQAALKQSDHVTLLVSTQPSDLIPSQQRVTWLQQLYPSTTVTVMPATWNVADAQAWADGALAALGGQRPDAVFSSEDYGVQLAQLWNVEHVMVDRERTIVPVSATQILREPEKYQHYLDPIVANYFFGAGKGSRTPFISLES